MTPNEKAFLSMIAWAEGTSNIPGGDNGYRVLVGSTVSRPSLFFDYSDHPRVLVRLSDDLSSTAAGRYQILMRIFDHYKRTLHLPDFSPASQDTIALQLIRERRALQDIDVGRIEAAISKCSSAWASLPGAGYGQPEIAMESLIGYYAGAGGLIITPVSSPP